MTSGGVLRVRLLECVVLNCISSTLEGAVGSVDRAQTIIVPVMEWTVWEVVNTEASQPYALIYCTHPFPKATVISGVHFAWYAWFYFDQ